MQQRKPGWTAPTPMSQMAIRLRRKHADQQSPGLSSRGSGQKGLLDDIQQEDTTLEFLTA
jgi:hypothetical protein